MKIKIGPFLVWLTLAATLIFFILAKLAGSGFVFSWLLGSQLLSLLGVTLLCLSFVLSSRWRFIENWFDGLDKVYRFHHLLGGLSFVLLLHHPIFLILEVLPDLNFAWRYLWLSTLLPYNWGILSLYSMMLMLIFTLLLNLPYSLWKKTHEFMGLALLFAGFHIITITSDVSRYLPLRWWILALLLLALYAAVYRRFLYRFIGPKYRFVIHNLRRIGDTYALDMLPEGKSLPFHAGQFVFAKFPELGNEAHPFSLASGPEEKYLRLVVKILGDYTWKIGALHEGSPVDLWGPYGKFGEAAFGDKPLIWIAGGIGVTPFLSLLTAEVQNKQTRQIDFFYCVGDEEEAVFDQEIKLLSAKAPNIIYHQYPSNVCGRLSAPVLEKLCGDLRQKKIMLCGPIGMMNSLATQLKAVGVKNRDIIFEDFNFK